MIVRQPPCAAVGRIHADNVIPVVTFREADPGTRTVLAPLNCSALPKRPCVVQVAPLSAPLLLLPDASAVVKPTPSLKPHAPTSPVGTTGAAGVVTPSTFE